MASMAFRAMAATSGSSVRFSISRSSSMCFILLHTIHTSINFCIVVRESNLEDPAKKDILRIYKIVMDELEVAREAYSEAAVRVRRLTEVANTLRNMLDS